MRSGPSYSNLIVVGTYLPTYSLVDTYLQGDKIIFYCIMSKSVLKF